MDHDSTQHDWQTCRECWSPYSKQDLADIGRMMTLDLEAVAARVDYCSRKPAEDDAMEIYYVRWQQFVDDMENVLGQGSTHLNEVLSAGLDEGTKRPNPRRNLTRLRSIRYRNMLWESGLTRDEQDLHDEWDYSQADGGVAGRKLAANLPLDPEET